MSSRSSRAILVILGTIMVFGMYGSIPQALAQFRKNTRPFWGQAGTAPAPVRMWEHDNFRGKFFDIADVAQYPQAKAIPLAGTIAHDRATSLGWRLPNGVIVVLFDNANGTGRQYVLWGNGQDPTLKDNDFNDRASAWAWFYVGG